MDGQLLIISAFRRIIFQHNKFRTADSVTKLSQKRVVFFINKSRSPVNQKFGRKVSAEKQRKNETTIWSIAVKKRWIAIYPKNFPFKMFVKQCI